MRKFLTLNTILLGGKGKGAESCGKKLIGISEMGMVKGASSNLHSHVLEAEWMFCIASSISIFAGAK